MIHPAIFAVGEFDEIMDGHMGAMGNPLMSQQFYETDKKHAMGDAPAVV